MADGGNGPSNPNLQEKTTKSHSFGKLGRWLGFKGNKKASKRKVVPETETDVDSVLPALTNHSSPEKAFQRKLSKPDSLNTASTATGSSSEDALPPPGFVSDVTSDTQSCVENQTAGPLPQKAESSGLAAGATKNAVLRQSSSLRKKPLCDLQQGATSGKAIREFLVAQGLIAGNCRMSATYEYLNNHADSQISTERLTKLRAKNILVERAFSGKLAIPDFARFCEVVQETFDEAATNKNGKVADYIPTLARANKNKFGVSVCSVHGQQCGIGDVHVRFSIQSTSKPLTYGMALEIYGPVRLENHVGYQPSGRSFNETVLMDPEGIPHNPCINAGAIMTASFVKMEPADTKWDRVDYVMRIWDLLCADGSDLEKSRAKFQYATFLAEAGTAARNNSLAWLMEEHDAFPEFGGQKVDLKDVLDAYFAWCSIELTCYQMSIVAATLANGGVNPLTQERVFLPATVKKILSIMFSCGMYDYSGEFAYQCGLPTKSGVGGALLIVIPGVCGMSTFSPPLDAQGNSVRGVELCQKFSARMGLHCFSAPQNTKITKDVQSELFWASRVGDLTRIRELIALRADVNHRDYDSRTALHLAACHNQRVAVEELLALKADPHLTDRYDNRPVDDSKRELADQCFEILNGHVHPKGNVGDDSRTCTDMEQLLLGHFHAQSVSHAQLAKVIAAKGLLVDGRDTRLSHLSSDGTVKSDSDELKPGHVVHKALCGELRIPNWDTFRKVTAELVAEIEDADEHELVEQFFTKRLRSKMTEEHMCKVLPEGHNIPEKTFMVSCWTRDGQYHQWGATHKQVTNASSIIWPLVVLFLKQDRHFDMNALGREPSSRSEDSLCLNADGVPFNPFMLTGELVMCEYFVKRAQQNGFQLPVVSKCQDDTLPSTVALELIERTGFLDMWRNLCSDGEVQIDKKVYDKLYGNFRVRQAVFYLLEKGLLANSNPIDLTVATWCALRCLLTTTSAVAFLGTLIANRGLHPFTGERVLDSESCQNMMSLLFACGGDWAAGNSQFLTGLPVKTARNGLCLMIVPDTLAICVLSPVLHLYQNSLKGMAFLKAFSGSFGLHVFERLEWDLTGGTWDLRRYWGGDRHITGNAMLNAAANGDILTLKEFLSLGVDLNYADYDQRTPLHVAAAEGQTKVVEFLLNRQANPEPLDRWGRKPIDDAKTHEHTQIVTMLANPEKFGYQKSEIGDGFSSGFHSSSTCHSHQIGGEWNMGSSAAAATALKPTRNRRLSGVAEKEGDIDE